MRWAFNPGDCTLRRNPCAIRDLHFGVDVVLDISGKGVIGADTERRRDYIIGSQINIHFLALGIWYCLLCIPLGCFGSGQKVDNASGALRGSGSAC